MRGAQIRHEQSILAVARFLVPLAEDRGGMGRGNDSLDKVGFQDLPALAGNAKGGSKNRLRRGRSKRDQDIRPNDS
jgi:hypothetical protein